MAEEVPLQAAQQLAVNPQLSDPVYPYGEITYVASSSNQPGPSGAEQALPKKGKRRHVLEPKDDICLSPKTTLIIGNLARQSSQIKILLPGRNSKVNCQNKCIPRSGLTPLKN
jgi:hypothetical protein